MKDKEILSITKGFVKGLTDGNVSKKCFMACAPLQGYLSMCGLETELIVGEVELKDAIWEHYWLKLPDGRILDPTAAQFPELNLPKIYIGEMPSQYTTQTINTHI